MATSTSMLALPLRRTFVGAGVVVPADIELHRRGQGKEEPVDPQRIGPRNQADRSHALMLNRKSGMVKTTPTINRFHW